MTDEQQKLIALIDGHCAAMKARVEKSDVPLEHFNQGVWTQCNEPNHFLYDELGTVIHYWHRLAPAPKLVSLDQSDFLGPNRVTHLRQINNPTSVAVVIGCNDNWAMIRNGDPSYKMMFNHYECSRDNGAPGSWGPCSKEAK